jgi:2-polyprenyl-6-methoxyphenol hydroxylase-like FAD-dependent oxidoreductase
MPDMSACDLVIIGGGLAGSALGRIMALAGYDVLIIEKETAFRDRVSGEMLLPWGSHEAHLLGIYVVLLERCATEVLREHVSLEVWRPSRVTTEARHGMRHADCSSSIRKCRKHCWRAPSKQEEKRQSAVGGSKRS